MSQTFGRYTVLGQLGRGAMGVVYLASDPLLNRQVAVKTVDLAVDDPQEREFLRNRLLRDARAAAVLKHPNIVSIYDVFEEGGRAYVVMEYVEGESLATRLKNNPLPDGAAILKVIGQAAAALDYTHAQGVIHRDIKPANIMVDSAGTTKIMDFGIARIADTRTVTPTGMVMGTVEYMAPEQIMGVELDGRADQFALAVVAYQMLTGGTLFGPNSLATLTYKLVHETPPLPSTRNAALPRGVDAVLAKALAKQPGGRFATCSEFAGALAQAFADAPTAPLAPTTAKLAAIPAIAQREAGGAEPLLRSRGALVAASVAVVVLGSALAVAIWKPWNRTPHPPAGGPTAAVAPAAPAETPKTKPAPAEPKGGSKTKAAAKSEPVAPAPPAPKAAPPPAAAKPAEAPDVPEEAEPAPLPPAPKTGGAPDPFTEAMRRAQQQMKENDYPGAIQSYTKAIGLKAKAPVALYNRGLAHQHLEQYELAIQDYSEAARIDPKMAMAYVGKGTCLVRLNRDDDALAQFQRAVDAKPDLPAGYVGRAGIYFRRKQWALALLDYDQAIKLNPKFAQAYESRARVREAIGDKAGADADRRTLAELRKQ